MKNKDQISQTLPTPLLWSLWILAAAITFKSFNQLIADYDLWFHLFLGREAFANAAIGQIDVYSFTAYGLPVINHEWLADIIMVGAYKIMGDSGLILWRWLMVLAIVLACLRLIKIRTENRLTQIFTFLCFVIVISPGISFRVQLFSYLFVLLLLNLVYSTHLKTTSVWPLLSILFLIWANIHGAFILGLLIWYIYIFEKLVFKSYKLNFSTAIVILAPVSVTLITPYEIRLWEFIYGELSNPISGQYITEWRRFSFEPRELSFLLVFLLTWTAFLFSGKAKGLAETIVLCLASLMGFMAVRHTPLFVILTLPSVTYHFDGALQRLKNKLPQGKPSPPIATYISTVLLLVTAAFFLYTGMSQPWKIQTDKDPLPFQSVAFLKTNNFKGNLWTPLHWGAYALFHLYPDIKVSIDGRWAMLYPHNVMQDNMDFAYHGTGGRWKKLLEKYGADFALVEAGNPAIQEMSQDKNWVWGFQEDACQLLVKKELITQFQ
ncbi:hypothetical protein QUF90_02750 [Desulfococcaceae bacterium HSG9]|nr:hypothetical protein [Desulfococcaceae bacterium HSG9]